ncbi:MAG: cardiolipin synthase, partial [Bacteroidales bacterium]|nr:cardiolipin synthase [Bacteroidales bacterium]
HRKIVIVDGKVAYTGGMNINNNYRYKWRDTHLRLEGPSIHALQASFIDTWLTSGGSIEEPLSVYFNPEIRGGDGPLKNNLIQIATDEPDFPYPNVQLSYEWILQNVRDYIYLENPYFGPPESVINALKAAALRGVDVRILLPSKVDTPIIGPVNRSFYTECMEAGIRIYQWKGEFIHCKTVVCDDYLTLTGASNMDVRSFQINHEVNAYVYSREMALASKEIFLKDLEQSQEVNLEEWKKYRKGRWYDVLAGKILRLADSVL